jgi:hypothetical protein
MLWNPFAPACLPSPSMSSLLHLADSLLHTNSLTSLVALPVVHVRVCPQLTLFLIYPLP